MKKVFFLRSASIKHDARLNKYLTALAERKIGFTVINWNRTGEKESVSSGELISFNRRGEFGKRFANLFNLLLWNLFIFINLFKERKSISVIHAVDFDCALPVYIFNKLYKVDFVYDVYDKYTDSRMIEGWLRVIIDKIDKVIISNSTKTILADESRVKQHNLDSQENIFIIENVPANISIYSEGNSNEHELVIGYVGGLERGTRGLEDVAKAVLSIPGVRFEVAGFGLLEDYFTDLSLSYPEKISFHGPVSHNEGMKILKRCDLVLGLYYTHVPNHLYAAPNKYYEHLFLGKAMITSKDTPPGKKVEKFDTGYVVEDGFYYVNELINELKAKPDCIINKGKQASELWLKKYSTYYEDTILKDYIKLITSI